MFIAKTKQNGIVLLFFPLSYFYKWLIMFYKIALKPLSIAQAIVVTASRHKERLVIRPGWQGHRQKFTKYVKEAVVPIEPRHQKWDSQSERTQLSAFIFCHVFMDGKMVKYPEDLFFSKLTLDN